MNMSRIFKIITSAVFVVAFMSSFFYGCEKQNAPEEKQTFKIGASLALTGSLGFIGEGMKNAMQLAKEQLEGGKYNIELFFEDDQLDSKLASTTANKLINIDKVDAVISVDAACGNIINHVATKNNVLHFGVAVSPKVAKGDTNFDHWTSPAEHSRVMIEEFQKRGIKKVGVLRSKYEDCDVHIADLRERLKGTDIEIVTDESFLIGETDFRSIITKVKEETRTNPPDIFIMLAMSPELEIVTKQLREAGIQTPLTTFGSFEATNEAYLFEGYWYVSAAEPTSGFAAAYKQKYDTNPPVCSGNAYDIVKLIFGALDDIDSAEKPSTQEIAEALMKIKDFKGAMGDLSIDDGGRVQSKAQVKVIKDGKFVPLYL